MADIGFLPDEDIQAIEEARRRRRRATGSPVPTTPYIPTSVYGQRAGEVERNSARLLPTRLVLAVAGLDQDEKDTARAAKLLARKFDVGPRFVFGEDWRSIPDPETGGQLTAASVRRYTDNFAPSAIAAMLAAVTERRMGPRGPVGPVPPEAMAVSRMTIALEKRFPQLPFGRVFGLAATLASEGIDHKRLGANLDAVQRWAEQTGASADPGRLINVTVAATQAKKNLRTNVDVVRFIAPALAAKAADTTPETRFGALGGRPTLTASQGEAVSQPEAEHDIMELAYTPVGAQVLESFDEGKAPLDAWARAQALEDQVRLDATAFERSLVGGAFVAIADKFNDAQLAIERGIVEIATPIAAGTRAVQGAVDADVSVGEAMQISGRWREERIRALGAGQHLGSQFAEDAGLPGWMGGGLDFALMWYLDPFVIGGKALNAVRRARLNTALAETLALPAAVARKVAPARTKAIRRGGLLRLERSIDLFAKSRLSKRLFRLAQADDEAAGLLREIDYLRVNFESRSALDHGYMKALSGEVRKLPVAERWDAWQEGMKAHFVGYAPADTAAGRAVNFRFHGAAQSTDALRAMPSENFAGKTFNQTDTGLYVPEATANDLIHAAAEGVENFAPFRFEVPRFRGPGTRFGPRRAVRRLQTSERFTSTALGRRVSRGVGINPGRMMNLERGADEYAYLHARRWGHFSEDEARAFQARALEILNIGARKEEELLKLVEDINLDGFKRLIAPYKLGQEAEDNLYLAIFDPIRERNMRAQVFGVTDSQEIGGIIGRPLLETQNMNFALVVDPIVVKNQIERIVGLPRRAHAHLARNIKDFDPTQRAAILAWLKKREMGIQDFIADDLLRHYHRIWKVMTVARPTYIPRVILSEEGGRSVITIGSLTERLLGQKMFGKLAEKTGAARLFKETATIGDETVELSLPWQYAHEPLASSRVREVDILDDITRKASVLGKDWSTDGSWRVITPGKTKELQEVHLRAWNRALVRQIGNSGGGRVALESVAAGEGITATTAKLATWARHPKNFASLQRNLAVGTDEIQWWSETVAQLTHAYTGIKAQRQLATAILDGSDDVTDILARVNLADRPEVHGPLLEMVQGVNGPGRIVDGLYKWFVRLPEDVLNRRPFYGIWKARAEKAYVRWFEHRGLVGKEVRGIRAEPLRLPKREGFGTENWKTIGRVPEEEGFVYHVTQEKGMVHVADAGVVPRPPAGAGTDLLKRGATTFEGGSAEAIAFWAKNAGSAYGLAPAREGYVMLRTRRTSAMRASDEFPSEFQTRVPVKPEAIEYLGADNKWHALVGREGLTPELRQAIDISSRDFALERVKEIMYDFTRQSRFTELLSTFLPFPQAFFEGFQAWGHIVVQHPEAIGRMRAIFDLGTSTGAIAKDENGEYVVPMGVFASVARFLDPWNLLVPERLRDSFSFTTPLQSFNMLTASSVRFGGEGWIGKIVGGVPIPVPGLAPELARLAQWAFKDSTNSAVASYLFAYGPKAQPIPRPLLAVVNKLFPSTIDDDQLQVYVAEVMKEYQRLGLDVDENGDPIPSDQLVTMATADAEQTIGMRQIMGLFSPAQMQVRFTHDDVEDEYHRRLEADGWKGAQEWLQENHPDLTLIGIGKTLFARGYETLRTEQDIRGLSVPASPFVAEFIKDPTFAKIAKRHPEWLGLFLIGLDPGVVEDFSPSTYSRMFADGWFKRRAPDEYWGLGEDAKVWREIDAYYKGIYTSALDDLEMLGVDDQDDAWARLRLQRQAFFTDVAAQFPDFARRHWVNVNQNEPGAPESYDWPFEPDELPFQIIYKDARMLASVKGFENFPGIKALNEVLDGYDAIVERMRTAGVSTTDSASGEKYFAQWDALKKKVLKGTPDMEVLLDNYFPETIQIESQQRANLRSLPGGPSGPRATAVAEFDTRLEVATQGATQGEFDFEWQRSRAWNHVREVSDSQHQTNPQVLRDWWNSLSGPSKDEYRDGLVGRPTIFWSRFDWEIAGVKVSKKAQTWLDAMANARVEISQREERNPGEYSESSGYEAIDRFVKAHKGKDKTFDAVIQRMSDWTFPVEAAGYDKQPGRLGEAWDAMIRNFRAVQDAVNRAELTGTGGFASPEDKNKYDSVQDQMRKWVREWFDYAPGFKRQWYDLQNTALEGKPIIGGLFLPEEYFGPIGAVDYA